MEMLWFFIPMVVFLGIVTSYEDTRGRGIRNKWIVLALAYSFAVLSSMVLYLFLSNQEIIFSYILDYFINIAISLVFGFVIWKAGFWSAGDGKLFLAYSALVPLSAYSIGYVRFFPSFMLFINTLLPVFVFLVGSLFMRTGFRKKALVLKKSFNPNLFLKAVLSLFGISWLIRVLFSFAGIQYDLFSFLVLVPVVYLLIANIAKGRMKWVFAFLVILRVLFDYTYIVSMGFAYRFAFIVVFYVFVKYFIFGLSYEFFSRPMSIEEVGDGMILADTIYKEGGKYVIRPQSYLDFPAKQKDKGKPIFNERGLTKEDVKKMKSLCREGKIGPELRIQSTMPFAIFMFFGVMLTIFTGGNAIITAKLLLGLWLRI